MQMQLTLSSKLLYYLNTTTNMKLSVDIHFSTLYDLKTCYAARTSEFNSISLTEFFYKFHKKWLRIQKRLFERQ